MMDHKRELTQKLFDNTINTDEIKDLEQKLIMNEYFEANFFMDFLTPLFFKDFSEILTSLININKKSPRFIPGYIKYCMKSNFDYFFDDEENKKAFYHRLTKLIQLLIEHKFSELNCIIEYLNHFSDLNLYLAQIIIKTFPQIRKLSPPTIEKFEKFNSLIQKSINDPNLCIDVAWPSVVIGDSNNPRISKFGGSQPFLPDDGCTLCKECHCKCSMICQIYIKTTPEWFRSRFNPEYQDSLIVILYCNSCFLNIEARLYIGDQLDSLVYIEDVVYPGVVNYTFNEPRIVTGWKSGKMMPIMGNSILNEMSKSHSFHYEELHEQFSRYNYVHGPSGENLTYLGGWPEFVQSDSTPPDSFLVMNLSQSCSSTAMWGDAGTAQVWMTNPIDGWIKIFV